jgi:hypothetical protein
MHFNFIVDLSEIKQLKKVIMTFKKIKLLNFLKNQTG